MNGCLYKGVISVSFEVSEEPCPYGLISDKHLYANIYISMFSH